MLTNDIINENCVCNFQIVFLKGESAPLSFFFPSSCLVKCKWMAWPSMATLDNAMNLGMEARQNRLKKSLDAWYHGGTYHLSLDHLPPDCVMLEKLTFILLKSPLFGFFCHLQPDLLLKNSTCVVDAWIPKPSYYNF